MTKKRFLSPQVVVTEGAATGLERCRQFLAAKAPEAARRAGQAIQQQFLLLETVPTLVGHSLKCQSCASWLLPSGIPAMWLCTAMSQPTMRCMSWHSATRNRRATVERESYAIYAYISRFRRRIAPDQP